MTVVGFYLLNKKIAFEINANKREIVFLSQHWKPQNTRCVIVYVLCLEVGRLGGMGCQWVALGFLTPLLLRDITQLCGFAIETLHAQRQVCTVP